MANKLLKIKDTPKVLIYDFLDSTVFPGDLTVTGDLTVDGSANIGVDETITGQLLLGDGSATDPSYSFTSDPDTGIGLNAASELSLIADGVEGLRIDANESEVQPKMTLATGNIELEEDSGAVTLINLPVSSTPSDGDEESYTFSVDSNPVLKIKGSADGTGGIYGKSVKIEGGLVLNDVNTFVDEDTTPNVSGATYFNTNTTTVIITDFDWAGKTIPAGQMLYVVSKGAITFDVTTSGIKGGTTDIVTAAGDLTTFLYDGTDWIVISRMDMSDDLN